MPPKPKSSAKGKSAHLRRQANARLRQQKRTPKSPVGAARLLHELQVHQIELEMQNAELQTARDSMEAFLEKYTDLYDFAPVGYFSLDDKGRILEANLTGAALLGVERSQLINRRAQDFVAPASQPVFEAFLKKVLARPGKQVCEAALRSAQGGTFWADLQAALTGSPADPRKRCRVAIADITVLKRAEEAQRHAKAVDAANQELKREIARRQVLEVALKKSKQHQTQLLQQSRRMQGQLRQLSHQILRAQEEERKRISRELHDEIVQTLVGINVHLENLTRQASVHPKGLKSKIVRTQRLVEKSVNMVHRFARELRPPLLDDLGLVATLHSFMKDFTKRTGIRVRFKTFAGVEQLSSAKRSVVYRVVQAALTNVAQHAEASRVEINLRKLPRAVHLEIKDNGHHFQVDQVLQTKKHHRLGVLGMRERVEMVGGRFVIESTPGQGTTIRAQIPLGNGTKP